MKIAEYIFNNSIDTLPSFNSGFTYTYIDVDNGDGTTTRTIESESLPTSIKFYEKTRLISLSYLDTNNITDMYEMFAGCSRLTSIDLSSFNTSKVTNMGGIFYNCINLTLIEGLNSFDTSNADNMAGMFNGCSKLTSLDLSNFNTEKVTNMSYMFHNCSALTSLDLSNFNTEKVDNMSVMFFNCPALTSLDLSNFNTEKVNNMSLMFQNCSNLTSLDLSSFNTEKVTNMSYMFQNCSNLTSLDLSNFNTSSVINMSVMFSGCSNLTSLDLSNFNTSSVTNMTYMFSNCSNLTSLDLSNFNTEKVTNMDYIFNNCSALTSVDMSNSNIDSINNIISVLPTRDASSHNELIIGTIDATSIDTETANSKNWIISTGEIVAKYIFNNSIDTLPSFNSGFTYTYTDIDNGDGTTTRNIRSNTTPTSLNFNYCTGLLEVIELDVSGLTTFANMFADCRYLKTLPDMTGWCTSKVTSLASMFLRCNSITSLKGCSSWDTSNVKSINQMFRNCGIAEFDAQNWDVRKITNMETAFRDSYLTYLNTRGWIWSSTTSVNFFRMFYGCTRLTMIEGIEDWDLSGANSIQQMFINCSKLTSLDLGNWNINTKCTTMQQMFSGCTSLTSLILSRWKLSSTVTKTNMFQNCSALTYINLDGWNNISLTDSAFSSCKKLARVAMNGCPANFINAIIGLLPTRTPDSYGEINITVESKDESIDVDSTTAESKYWNTLTNFPIALYKFNKDIDTLPTFNFSNFAYTDSPNEDDTITRKIYHNISPTSISFYGKTGLLEIEFLDMSNVSNVQQMFFNCASLTKVNTDNWNLSKVTNTSNMFRGCSVLTELDLSELNLGNVTNMQSMFNKCSVLTTIGDTSSWNVSKVTNMNYMFEGCSSLKQLNVSNWDVGKLKTMTQTFDGCVALTELDVSNWNTESLTNSSMAFSNCSVLTVIDVSNWNVSSVTTMLNMFSGCSSLAEINLSKWDISSLTNTGNMFNKCSSLKSLDISNLNMSKITNSNNMFSATNLRKVKLLDNPISTIERIVNLLPAKKTGDVGYLFVRNEILNNKYWENIICKELIQSIYLPQQLNKKDDISDRLYWDIEKECYCIEQNIEDGNVLGNSNVIDLFDLNEKYYYDVYSPVTVAKCENCIEQPSRILLQSDIKEYLPSKLKPSTEYTIQFNCITNDNIIIFRIDNINIEVQAKIGINKLTIITPDNITDNRLYIIGKEDKISEIMLIEGEVNQTPNYFYGSQFVGKLQEDGTYRIKITTNTEGNLKKQSFTIITNIPFGRNDRIYWSKEHNNYVIDRNGIIEIATIEEDVIDLPRLYQREDTYLNIDTDNIKPSKIKIEYRDIK